jgi:hypothetical protein
MRTPCPLLWWWRRFPPGPRARGAARSTLAARHAGPRPPARGLSASVRLRATPLPRPAALRRQLRAGVRYAFGVGRLRPGPPPGRPRPSPLAFRGRPRSLRPRSACGSPTALFPRPRGVARGGCRPQAPSGPGGPASPARVVGGCVGSGRPLRGRSGPPGLVIRGIPAAEEARCAGQSPGPAAAGPDKPVSCPGPGRSGPGSRFPYIVGCIGKTPYIL